MHFSRLGKTKPDLYHVCNDPRIAETNDRLIQINDSLQKDYQSAVALAEHRHLLTVSRAHANDGTGSIDVAFLLQWTDGACPIIN